MTARPLTRALVGIAVASFALGGVAGCSPSDQQPEPTTRPSRSVAAPATACSPGARSVPVPSTVPYSALPDQSGFTAALASAGGQVVSLEPGTTQFQNFTSIDGRPSGGVIGPGAAGLVGAGEEATTLELVPQSSTFAASVPARFPQTNPLYVLRASGDGIELRDFTVAGTPQGHLFNGLRVDNAIGLRASHLRVVDVPGNAPAPPGETFGINDYRTTGSLWRDITIDGLGIGGSGFGVNSSKDVTICDTLSTSSGSAMGFAFWQSSGIRCVDCTATDNAYAGFNFERVSGSNVLVRPVATGNRYDMRVGSDQASARITIIDPTLVRGRWTVTLPAVYAGVPNKQRRQDITLIVRGKERPDLLRFETQR